MKTKYVLKLLAVMIASIATLSLTVHDSKADQPEVLKAFDVSRDLAIGDLFYLTYYQPNLAISWNGEAIELRFLQSGAPLQVTQRLDSAGRIIFSGYNRDRLVIHGQVDLLPGGQPILEADIQTPDGSSRGLKVWQLVAGVPFVVGLGTCDCDDNITFGCKTNHCNAGSACKHPAENHTCVWTAAGYSIAGPLW